MGEREREREERGERCGGGGWHIRILRVWWGWSHGSVSESEFEPVKPNVKVKLHSQRYINVTKISKISKIYTTFDGIFQDLSRGPPHGSGIVNCGRGGAVEPD